MGIIHRLFPVNKVCLTAQWIVIRLKAHCKSFSSVGFICGAKQDTAENCSLGEKDKLCEGHTVGTGGLYPRQAQNLHDVFKHKHID